MSSQPPAAESLGPDLDPRGRGREAAPVANSGLSGDGASTNAASRNGESVFSSPELEEARVVAPRWQLQVPLAAPRWQVPAIALPPCWVHSEPLARSSASPETRATPFPAAPAEADELDPADCADLAPAKQEPKLLTRLALEWIGILAGALIVALIIKALLVQAFVIPSRSMEPTLAVGDRVLVFRPSYQLQDVDRGDVVVFDRPEQLRGGPDDPDLIKRVIGLAEETVEGRDGVVYVNGVRLEEPWLREGVRTSDFALVRVPAEHVWVMGDNRDNSQDSRVFGTLVQDRIIGEAFLRWWPVSRLAGL